VSFEVSPALPRRQQVEKPAESCGSVHACQLRLSGGVLGPIEVCGWFRAANLTHTQWNAVIRKVLRDNVAASCLQQIRGREVDKAENCLDSSILYPFLNHWQESILHRTMTVSAGRSVRTIIDILFVWVSKSEKKSTNPRHTPNQPHQHPNPTQSTQLGIPTSTTSVGPSVHTGTPPPRSP
jgi:hypothetical protein